MFLIVLIQELLLPETLAFEVFGDNRLHVLVGLAGSEEWVVFLQGATKLLLNLAHLHPNVISIESLLYLLPFISIFIVFQPYLTVPKLFIQFHLLPKVIYEPFGLPSCHTLLLYVILHWNHL